MYLLLGGAGGRAEVGILGGGAGASAPGESILFLGGSWGGNPEFIDSDLGGATGGRGENVPLGEVGKDGASLSGLCFKLTVCWASRAWRFLRASSSLFLIFLLLLLASEDLNSSTTLVCCSIMSWSVCILSLIIRLSASLLAGLGPVISPSNRDVNLCLLDFGLYFKDMINQ